MDTWEENEMPQDRTIDFHEEVVLDERPEVADDLGPLGKVTENHQKRDPTRPATRKGMARAKVIAPLVVVLLAAAATLAYRHYAGWESTDDAQIDGYINPISSRVAGYITKVYVDDNQYVKAGTLLAKIDPKDYEVSVASAQATLANDQATAVASRVNVPVISVNTSSQLVSAEAEVANARAGISASEQQLAAAQAAVVQAEASSAKAQDDVQRYKQLVDKQEIPEQLYVQAAQTANGAAAGVQAALANVQAAQDAVHQAQSRLAQASASVESAQTGPQQIRIQKSRAVAAAAAAQKSRTAVEQAQLNLSYTSIVAPVDGVVAKRSAQPGQYVSPGQELMAIVPLDDIWVTANFKETQLRNMRPGNPVKVDVDAYGRTYTGRVESIAGGTGSVFSLLPPENATGNYVKVVQRVPVRLRLDKGQDPDRQLRPGMSVMPRVNVEEHASKAGGAPQ
jgi:membrane fusion protein (multidrug efflux system)